jgi:hypothetical protein
LAEHNIPVVRQAPYFPDVAPCEFWLFPHLKCSWNAPDLSHVTTLYETQQPSCTPFAKRHSRNASNNGGTAGRSVFSHKETTLKGIRVADLHACKCIFPGQRSDTFWTAVVCTVWQKIMFSKVLWHQSMYVNSVQHFDT